MLKGVSVSGLIYLSHSYRPRDAAVNDYFVRLMESEDLLPSLDPPSTFVNSAKLERHLDQSDAMIAILTERETGVSPHIIYEIALGVRSRKPLLVFVEDTLPSTILPVNVLQRRFSLHSFPRHIREHRQSLMVLRDYIGEAPPRYQASLTRRTCLLLGGDTLRAPLFDEVQNHVQQARSYEVLTSDTLSERVEEHPMAYNVIRETDLVIAFTAPDMSSRDSYLLGVLQGACKPLVNLTTMPAFPPPGKVPAEYKPRTFSPASGITTVLETLDKEVDLYEEDFLSLENTDSTDRYIQFLIDLGGRGLYAAGARRQGVEVVMGDRYDVRGQTGAVGPNAEVHDVTFNQIWQEVGSSIDLPALADELGRLRATLRADAKTPEDDQVVAEIGQAERAARDGNGSVALRHLRGVGKWALSAATAIGAGVAVAAIKAATGV
jgi:hypothetical protein